MLPFYLSLPTALPALTRGKLALPLGLVAGKPLRVGVAKTAQAITRETPAHLLLHRSTQKMKEMMENGTLDETLMSLQEKRVRFPSVLCVATLPHNVLGVRIRLRDSTSLPCGGARLTFGNRSERVSTRLSDRKTLHSLN